MSSHPLCSPHVAASLLVTALVLCTGCPLSSSDRPVDPETGVLNFHKVSDDLYRGGHATAESLARLKDMGIRTVVSLRTFDVHTDRLEGLSLRYVHISFKANHPEDEDVVQFLQVLADPANRPVFVHCKWGTDRCGMMAAVCRIVVQGWTKQRALAEMERLGYDAATWPEIQRYVEDLDPHVLRKKVAAAEPVVPTIIP
ncbi:MAG: tyrosine-protein phosphatase [Phycisphaerae bacterium]